MSSLQPVEKPIGDSVIIGFMACNRASLKRLVDEASQAAVLRVVVAEHVQRKKADRPRQEPQYSRLCPAPRVGRIAREGLMILQ